MDVSQNRRLSRRLKGLASRAYSSHGEMRRSIWEEHSRVRSLVLDAQPAYATTVHRSQGSTWGSVFIAQGDICCARDELERAKLMYVAASRAAKELHVCG